MTKINLKYYPILIIFIFQLIGINFSYADNLIDNQMSIRTIDSLIQIAEKNIKRNPKSSFDVLDDALSISQFLENKSKMAYTNYLIGLACKNLGQNEKAKYSFLTSLSIYDSLTFDLNKINNLIELGNVYRFLGDEVNALMVLTKALNISRESGEALYQIKSLNALGIFYRGINEESKAFSCYDEALNLLSNNYNNVELIKLYINYGNLYYYQNKFDVAKNYYDSAYTIITKDDIKDELAAGLLNNLGNIARKEDNFLEALNYYNKSLILSKEIGDNNLVVVTLKNFGLLYKQSNNFKKAESSLLTALKLSEEVKLMRFTREILFELQDLYEKSGDYKNSLIYLKQYNNLKDSVFSSENKMKLDELKLKYNSEIQKNHIESLENSRKNIIIILLIVAFILSLAVAIVFFLFNRSNKLLIKDQRLISALIKNLPLELWAIDADGKFILQNDLSKETWGNLVNSRIYDINRHNIENNFIEVWDNIINRSLKGESIKSEFNYERDDFNKYYTIITTPIQSNKGIDGVIGVFIDSTETVHALEALKKSEQMFRSYFELPLIGVAVLSVDLKWIRFNDRLCQILGYEREELMNLTWADITYKKEIDNELIEYNKVLEGTKIPKTTFEKKYVKKNGEIITVNVSTLPVKRSDGTIDYFVAIIQDVTDKKELEINLRQAYLKAEESNKLKNSLLSNLSHEIRTPLTAIIGFSQILIENIKNPTDRHFIENINNSGKRLLMMLNSLLEFSELEANLVVPLYEKFDLVREIRYLFRDLETFAYQKNLSFEYVINVSGLILNTDKKLLILSISNIIDNAIKYTDSGGIVITIDHEQINNIDYMIIKISDTGIGIAKENQSLIFEEFRQISEGMNRSFEGSGLGLTIVKKVIPLLNGEVHLDSEVGKGSTFTIKIPCMPTKVETNLMPDLVIGESEHKKIGLLVEDNELNVELTLNFLAHNYNLDYAMTGEQAIQMATEKKYDFILMDINLGSGLDGVSATQEIKKLKQYEKTPIIALTGMAMQRDKGLLLSKGLTHYISKPFSRGDILRLLEEILG